MFESSIDENKRIIYSLDSKCSVCGKTIPLGGTCCEITRKDYGVIAIAALLVLVVFMGAIIIKVFVLQFD